MLNLFIYGSGSTGCELVDIANRINQKDERWNKVYFVDDVRQEREHYGCRIYRFEEMLTETAAYECCIAQGEPKHRRMLYGKVVEHGIRLATVVDPCAVVSDTATIGAGCIVGPHSFVSNATKLADNAMLEIGAIVGHDIQVGAHSVISSGSIIGGHTVIGTETFIGLNSTVKERVCIGSQCVLGMGSCLLADLDDKLIALGNPARAVRRNDDSHRIFETSHRKESMEATHG